MSGLRSILFIVLLLGASSAYADPVEVLIRGIEGDALANAQKALVLPYGLVQNGTVNVFWLERFAAGAPDAVRHALEPYGYYKAVVREDLKKIAENNYRLVVDVDPGPPVRLAAVSVSVSGPGSSEKVLHDLAVLFPLRAGDVLLQKKYEDAKGEMKFRAVGLGYLDADFSKHTIEIDPGLTSAHIELVLSTGEQYRFGDVTFEGALDYPVQFLHRYVVFKPGDVFSYAKLSETQLNLINTDRFKEVLPVPEKDKAQNLRVPVVIRVREAPSKRLRPGIGYATDIGPRFSIEYRDLNEFGRGHEFHSELNLSGRLQNLGAGYILPDPVDINSFSSLQLNLKREDVVSYTNNIASAEIDRTRGFRRGRLGTLYLKFDREDALVGNDRVEARLVVPGVRFSERHFNSLTRPTRGVLYSIDLGGTHQALGSNTKFVQIVTQGDSLLPLPWRLSLYSRVKLGVTFQNAPLTELPVSYRFFSGGDRSVRGYAYQSLGPVGPTGTVTGGRDLLEGSLELDRAIFQNWGVAVFYDAGNAFNSFADIHLFEGAGVGARYYTVVGALRLDVARQIAVPHPGYRIHFTVGFVF